MASQCTILITRSGAAGQQLAARLEQPRQTVIHYAPVRLDAMPDPDQTRRQLRACLPVDVLVMPSAEAVRRLVELLTPAELDASVVVVPGPGTAEVARRSGFQAVRFPERIGNSEEILQLPDLQGVAGARVLIAAAAGGRNLIAKRLRQRGATVFKPEVYQRIATPPTSEQSDRILAATCLYTLVASGGALLGLQQHLPPSCWGFIAEQPMIVPSPRVAAMAEAAECVDVTVADAADNEAMIAALARVCPSLATISYPV